MNDTAAKSEEHRAMERHLRKLRERRERQRLHLITVQAAYDLLGAEIRQTEDELAKAS